MEKLIETCEYFYNAHHIPVYIYQHEKFVTCFPVQPKSCHPDTDFNDYIRGQNVFLCYITADNLIMGYIPAMEGNVEILIGPINAIPYSHDQLEEILFRKHIVPAEHKECIDLYSSIPSHSQVEFIDILLFLQFILTGKKIKRDDFFTHQNHTIKDLPSSALINPQTDSELSILDLHNNEIVLHHIENGDYDSVFQYLCSQQNPPEVDFANSLLEQRRLLAYYSIALFVSAALRGGLTTLEGTQIAATYYRDIAAASSIEKIDFLNGRAALFLANKVASIRLPKDANAPLLSCIQFVRHNVYNHIQVNDIASYIGYSRVHVTRLFNEELGFGPGQFIMRTKLEEAKILLQHTDKSLSEISTQLCFANQSHFQRNFKTQFGVTPMEYRKKSPNP